MATLRSDPPLSLNADNGLGRYPEDFYLDYSPYHPPSTHPVADAVLGLQPILVWNHPILGRLLPDMYDPGSQSVVALRHMLDHLLLNLKQHEAVAPRSLSLFVVLSAAQLSAPSLSHWFMPIQLVMAYHNWSLSLALSADCRKQCGSRLTRLCEQGPLCVVDTAQSERATL